MSASSQIASRQSLCVTHDWRSISFLSDNDCATLQKLGTCVCVCVCACAYVHVCALLCVCVCVCCYVYVYVCVCVCDTRVCMHTPTVKFSNSHVLII